MIIENDCVCIPSDFIYDKELSLEARGLYGMIYSILSDGRARTVEELKRILESYGGSIDQAWSDLEKGGYLDEVNKYFELNLPDRSQFYIFPETLITDDRYKWISADAKLFYGCVLDYLSQHRNLKNVFDIRNIEYEIKPRHLKMLVECGLLIKIPKKRYKYQAMELLEV